MTVKYPKSVAFIISNEFCERFNYYGMRTILVLYLTRRLGYNDDSATVLFHVFTSLAYFFPVFGAIIADSWLGRFKTILYLSIVYTFGSIIITVGSIPQLNLPGSTVTVIGLLFIAFGTGGIKPCVSAFGGDQFRIPEQARQLATFFSLFYMAINAGSLISTTITPILREDVHCFGEPDCFPLAFGVPGVLMICSIVIFIFGKPFYQIHKPSGNMIVEVSKCVGNAIVTRTKERKINPRSHWLEYAEPKYGKKLVEDIRLLLKILVLYLPLPVFWALMDQQGSRWTFQATRMTGEIGSFTIKPDQMQVVNPLLIILFIPLFDYIMYPLLERIGLKRPLQKLGAGMLLAAIAFTVSGLIELKLETTNPILPRGNEAQLRIFNGMQCEYKFDTTLPIINSNNSNLITSSNQMFTINSLDVYEEKHILLSENSTEFNYQAVSTTDLCPSPISGTFKLKRGKAISYFIKNDQLFEYEDFVEKPTKGLPLVRVLAGTTTDRNILLKNINTDYSEILTTNDTELNNLVAGTYDVLIDDIGVSTIDVKIGGSYTVVIVEKSNVNYLLKNHIIATPNTVHLLWQIPQYVIMTTGELFFSVTGLEFSFTQAPASMKSVLQACWLLAVAFGNIIVVIVAKVNVFESQAYEFFLFATLMLIDLAIFIILALRYTYINVEKVRGLEETTMTKVGSENMAYAE